MLPPIALTIKFATKNFATNMLSIVKTLKPSVYTGTKLVLSDLQIGQKIKLSCLSTVFVITCCSYLATIFKSFLLVLSFSPLFYYFCNKGSAKKISIQGEAAVALVWLLINFKLGCLKRRK